MNELLDRIDAFEENMLKAIKDFQEEIVKLIKDETPKRLLCIKCGEPVLDRGQDESLCGACAN